MIVHGLVLVIISHRNNTASSYNILLLTYNWLAIGSNTVAMRCVEHDLVELIVQGGVALLRIVHVYLQCVHQLLIIIALR